MPDKKLTDSEIIKALEYCQNQNEYTCDDCPYREENHIDNEGNFEVMSNGLPYDHYSCDVWLQADALDLINRLQAENERLTIRLRKAEHQLDDAMKMYNTIKAEAYKEFAERLHCECQSIINQPHNENVRPVSWKVAYEEFDEKVDNLLKELGGEDNA